jgi:peptide/nickel transport system ATP-binding protein
LRALDVSIRSQVLNLMKRLQDTHGMTYVVIPHDMAVVKYLADRIGVMYLGKMVETGSADDIYQRPVHHYTAGLIATIPEPDPDKERAKHVVPVTGELPSAVNPPSGCRFRTRCPAAASICAEEEPPLRAFGPGHMAACHLPLLPPIETQPGAALLTARPEGRGTSSTWADCGPGGPRAIGSCVRSHVKASSPQPMPKGYRGET